MPVFTLLPAKHPNYTIFGTCFVVDILSPDLTDINSVYRAFIQKEFTKSVVGTELAHALGFEVHDGEAIGSVVLQTYYEGGPWVHRTVPIPIHFKCSPYASFQKMMHLAYSDLQPFLVIKRESDAPTESTFLYLRPAPEVSDILCVVMPLERLADGGEAPPSTH